jgi:hypothetical protein
MTHIIGIKSFHVLDSMVEKRQVEGERRSGLDVSRGSLSDLSLRDQREGDPFCDYERSECKISSDERHCVPRPARVAFHPGTDRFSIRKTSA